MKKNTPITNIKGIGEKRAKLFEKLGISTIEDLIHYYPRDYETKKDFRNINELLVNETNLIRVQVCQGPENIFKKNLIITKMKVKDQTGELWITWFKQPYMKNRFSQNESIILKGKVIVKYNKIQMQSPQVIEKDALLLNSSQELFPIYPLTKDLSLKYLSNSINLGLEYSKGQLKDYLPNGIKEKYQLCAYNYALHQIHNPEDQFSLELAKKRLIFQEFLTFQLGLLLLKNECFIMENQFAFPKNSLEKILLSTLPFQLTNAQKKAWLEIKKIYKAREP